MTPAIIHYTNTPTDAFGGMALLGFARYIAEKYKLAISTDRALLTLTSEAQM